MFIKVFEYSLVSCMEEYVKCNKCLDWIFIVYIFLFIQEFDAVLHLIDLILHDGSTIFVMVLYC